MHPESRIPFDRVRRARGLSISQLARLRGISTTVVGRWCTGEVIPSGDHRDAISRLLGVDEAALWPDELYAYVPPACTCHPWNQPPLDPAVYGPDANSSAAMPHAPRARVWRIRGRGAQ